MYGTGTAARVGDPAAQRVPPLHRRSRPRRGARPRCSAPPTTARDPALSLWVHATLVDSTLATGEAWLGPIPRDVRARFYAETVPIARLFGVPEGLLPADIEAFDAYVASMLAPDGPVHPTPIARDLASVDPPSAARARRSRRVRSQPGSAASSRPTAAVLRAVPAVAYDWLLVPSIGLLPPSTRDEYGLAWGPRERAIDAWLTTAWGFWRGRLPPAWRWFPQALAADRRVAAVS